MWVDRLSASTAVLVPASQKKGHAESQGANWFVVCVLLLFLVLALIKAGSRNSWLYCHCLLSVFRLNCSPSQCYFFLFFTCFSDLQRLGELQSELAGMADFTATYLQCQLLLIKVWLHLWFFVLFFKNAPSPSQWHAFLFWCSCWKVICDERTGSVDFW